jgi:hypothetical protein
MTCKSELILERIDSRGFGMLAMDVTDLVATIPFDLKRQLSLHRL